MQHLLQNYSDHLPLLVSTRGFAQIYSRLKLFRFQVVQTTHEGFGKGLQKNRPENTTIIPALRSLSRALNTWNKEVFGNLFRRKRKLWACFQGIQRKLMLKLETRLKGQLREVLDQTETFQMHKSRVEAIQDRDRNTHYLHTSTVTKRKFNRIEVL